MRFLDQERYPCQQPPWGELTAVDVNTGEIAWKVPLGSFPELEAQGLKNAGTPNVGGTIATASRLVFVAATNDAKLRAFDSRTGRELWAGALDASGNATPRHLHRAERQAVRRRSPPAGPRTCATSATRPTIGPTPSSRSRCRTARSRRRRPPRGPRRRCRRVRRPRLAELPADPGRDLVLRMCTGCHAVQAFSGSRLNATEWELMVSDMRLRGARGTDDEARAVVAYLSKHLAR